MFSQMSEAEGQGMVPEYGHIFFSKSISTVPPRYALPKYRDVAVLRKQINEFKDQMQQEWQDELKQLDFKQQQLCPTCRDLTSQIAGVRPAKGAGKKIYNQLTSQKQSLETQLELHRASGCDKVEVVVDFPLLTQSQVPHAPASQPANRKKHKPKKKKKVTLEDYVHRQIFYKKLAGLKKRKNELCEGDLVAVLGPSRDEPY